MKKSSGQIQYVSRTVLVIFIFMVVSGVSFVAGYQWGKKQQTPLVAKPTEILNEDYIASINFPPLQGEMISGEEDSYAMPLLRKYTDGDVSFSYPVDFTLSHDQTQAVVLTKQARCMNVNGTFETCTGTIKLFSLNNTAHMNLHDWFVQEDLRNFLLYGKIDETSLRLLVRQTTIGGEKALFYDGEGQPAHISDSLIFLHKNRSYELSITSYDVPGAAATFREVASSLTFTQ